MSLTMARRRMNAEKKKKETPKAQEKKPVENKKEGKIKVK